MEREISDLRGDGNTGQQAAAVPPCVSRYLEKCPLYTPAV